jgi:predicted methyltransferase
VNEERHLVRAVLLSLAAASCAPPPAVVTPSSAAVVPATDTSAAWRAIVDAPDRTAKDRGLDQGRHPLELLAFLDVKPGAKVADLGAGPGYTTELLARAVGAGGTVYMENEPTWLPFLEDDLRERFSHAAMKGVVRVDRSFGDPLPPEAKGLSVVVMNLIYHDIVNTPTNRAQMNRRIFDALAPGGAYVVIDSSARAGTGVSATDALHRIDEQVVRDEVPKAGFTLAAEGTFLRNPADTRDWSSAPTAATKAGKRGTSDRFVLKFVKP